MTNQQKSDAQKVVDAVGDQMNPFASSPAEAYVNKGFRDGYQHGIEESYRVAKDAFERPDSDISSRIYIPSGEFSLQVTSDGISDDLHALLTGTAKPAPDSTGESVDPDEAWAREKWAESANIASWSALHPETQRVLVDFARSARAEPAPTDDLPGEPVEPGDLRAGDRVAFTFMRERITCTLVSASHGDILRSNALNSEGYYPNVVVDRGGKWGFGIFDARLIERAAEKASREARRQ